MNARDIILSLVEGHSYSCLMADVPDDLSQKILQWNKQNIPESILWTEEDGHGREDDPHITVKWGLDDAKPTRALKKILKETKPIIASLGKISLFEADDYDVVKIEVHSDGLHKLHQRIKDTIPNTETHPTYNPHLTLAYVKKGQGKQFVGKRPLSGNESNFEIKRLTFSDKDRNHSKLMLSETAEQDKDDVWFAATKRRVSGNPRNIGWAWVYRIPRRLANQILEDKYGPDLIPEFKYDPTDCESGDLFRLLQFDKAVYLDVIEELQPHSQLVHNKLPIYNEEDYGPHIWWKDGDIDLYVVFRN